MAHTHTHMHIHTHAHACTHTHAHTHMHINTYMHAFIHRDNPRNVPIHFDLREISWCIISMIVVSLPR